jgi:hypothetical protein
MSVLSKKASIKKVHSAKIIKVSNKARKFLKRVKRNSKKDEKLYKKKK